MKRFRENSYGGIDVFENDKFLLHLNNEDLMAIGEIRQRQGDLYTVRDRIPDWVVEQTEERDDLMDFACHLSPDDEFTVQDIYEKILADEDLIQEIVKAYRFDLDYVNGVNWWDALNNAIEKRVSVRNVMGDLVCEKHHKELEVGRWKVAVLEKGDAYGLHGKLTYDKAEPAVEFYDMQSGGQFTGARYALSSLLTSDWSGLSIDDRAKEGLGLSLYGDVPEWTVVPAELNVIGAWLNAVQTRVQAKALEEKMQGEVEGLIADAKSRTVGEPARGQEREVEMD